MERLKIVIISDWFSENMGYGENFLTKTLAALGHDVHLVTSTAQIYYNSLNYNKTYKSFLGENIVNEEIKKIDNYTLHRLPLVSSLTSMPCIKGLTNYLDELKPQIIQTFSINSWSTYEAAQYCSKNNCKLFTESHMHASVFRKKRIFKKETLKIFFKYNVLKLIFNTLRFHVNFKKLKFINSITELCYPIAPDVSKIAIDYFLVPKSKIKIQSLGVDTDLFHPADSLFKSEKRDDLRAELGLKKDSLVCVYTGRFTLDKKPQCLARAIDYLQDQGENIQALFVGSGTEDEIKEINKMKGCIVHEFVQVKDLPKFYWISDVGVWPSQESTSQLDAAACGLPLILSNLIEVKERIDGNGLLYKEDDEIDLAQKIMLLKDNKIRQEMSYIGSNKVKNTFSWMAIAKERINDYHKSLLV